MDEVIEAAAMTHQALGHPTRLEICWLLAERERSVTELAEKLGISQPLASQHLRVLKDAGLVAGRRESYWTLCRLLPARLELLREGAELLIGSVRNPRARGRRRT